MRKTMKTTLLLLLVLFYALLTASSGLPVRKAGASACPAAAALLPPDFQKSAPVSPAAPEDRADDILAGMSLPEKVGQLFLVHYPDGDVAELIRRYHFGGFILFAKDFDGKTPGEITAALAACQESSKIPMLIGVDEEGGTVNRVSRFPQFRPAPFLSPQALYKEGGWPRIVRDTREKAQLLKALGINLNLAPVCDIGSPSSYIYPRTIGGDAALTARYAETVAAVMRSEHLGCVLKHFPGYGGSADTHTGPAVDARNPDAFAASDFLPFKAGIAAGAGAVMVSHNIVSGMSGKLPASLSPQVHRILREELDFTGVVITDDLNMAAVRDYFSPRDSLAVLALLAGNDLLLCPDFDIQLPAVLAAAENGTIPPQAIDAAVRRILLWKLELGILK